MFSRSRYSGSTFATKMTNAISNFELHNTAHRAFTAGLRQVDASALEECEVAVIAWEQDSTKPCPFKLNVKRLLLFYTISFIN
jgi:hypothetical protein